MVSVELLSEGDILISALGSKIAYVRTIGHTPYLRTPYVGLVVFNCSDGYLRSSNYVITSNQRLRWTFLIKGVRDDGRSK